MVVFMCLPVTPGSLGSLTAAELARVAHLQLVGGPSWGERLEDTGRIQKAQETLRRLPAGCRDPGSLTST